MKNTHIIYSNKFWLDKPKRRDEAEATLVLILLLFIGRHAAGRAIRGKYTSLTAYVESAEQSLGYSLLLA